MLHSSPGKFLAAALLLLQFASCRTSTPVATPSPETAPPPIDLPAPAAQEAAGLEARLQNYQKTPTRLHDLVHTRLQVSFDWQKQHVKGTATLELRPWFYPQQTLVLDAKGFDIHSVQLLEGSSHKPLKYEYDGLKLNIALGREYSRDEAYFVEIEYTAKPNEQPAGGSEAITSDKGLYFINPLGTEPGKPRQIWTQGETEANSKWFPTIDAPNQKTTQEIYITVDNRYKTLSNGILVQSSLVNDSTRTDYWRMDKPHAPYLFMLAIGDFAVVEESWNGLPVEYWVEPQYERYAKAIFGNTPEMLTYFSDLLDYPYPWSKYAQVVVRDYVSGAMENTTASLFMEELQVDDRSLLDENWDYIIAHELFHQWFGDLVTTESWSNLTLNEAFASYSEYLWSEYKWGEDAAAETLLKEGDAYFREAAEKQVDLIRFYYDDKEDMFDSHTYAKGSRILHMLRKYVGDEAFFTALHRFLKKHEYQPVEVHDLRLAFEEVTGEDLNWFFNQWFLASGHPVLQVDHRWEGGNVVVQVEQQQDLSTTPLYELPLYVDVVAGGQKTRYAIRIDKQQQEFSFPASQQPQLVVFDAEEQLLAEISHTKSAEELRNQYRLAENFISRYKALAQLTEEGSPETLQLMKAALADTSSYMRRTALAAFEEYEGADSQQVYSQLAKMAASDKNSLVRADAMSILAASAPNAYKELFRKGLEDRSYAVVTAAVYGYALSDATDIDQVLRSVETITEGDVPLALAEYYVGSGQTNRYDWFVSQLPRQKGINAYYFLNTFGQYLMAAPQEQVVQGAQLLEKLALSHAKYYVRMAAFNALAIQASLPERETLLRKIAEQEQDPRLKREYQNFF
ncbi:M1 family metallopeptidase [Cesiribacter andamanensis]|uniref:Aminopeptidase N n=1 Tax=Cesiribacter andamanensis AMV16 TaxID=1279009 RepID=M7N610_9BACT|nr:M1 family aminopeptidase [Cesiribacter andamanensis]EMR04068.1 Aminopeptidase N [Cesiribacter andamanensis AMV16]